MSWGLDRAVSHLVVGRRPILTGVQDLGEESTTSTMSHDSLTLSFCSQLITSYLVPEAQDGGSHSCGVKVFCLPLPRSRWLWEHRLPQCQTGLETLGLSHCSLSPQPHQVAVSLFLTLYSLSGAATMTSLGGDLRIYPPSTFIRRESTSRAWASAQRSQPCPPFSSGAAARACG